MEMNGQQAEKLISQIGDLPYVKLEKLSINGVFLKRQSRKSMMEKVKNQQGLRMVLFEPQYSGDESENNDQENFWEMA